MPRTNYRADGEIDLFRRHRLEIGRRLAAAMAYRGISMIELAARSGVHRQTIWRYANGKTEQSLPRMALICSVLRVRLEYVAYGDVPMDPPPTEEES